LSSGATTDCLKDEGKVPEDRDRLMMLVIVGARTEMDCLRRDVGIGSSSHCLVGDCRMSLVISLMSVGRNSVSFGGVQGG
jgi:hypothetical protein